MSHRFLMQLQAVQILSAYQEGHRFSKCSTESDQVCFPVHFLSSSKDNCSCYLMRLCNLSHFPWSIPIGLHWIHSWVVTGCTPSCSLSVYGPTVHKFARSFLNLTMLSVSTISCVSKFHKDGMRYSMILHQKESWACLSDFLSREFRFLRHDHFKKK